MTKTNLTKSGEEIAQILDLSLRRVQQLVKSGYIPRVARGRYELIPAIHGYIKYLRELSFEADAPTDLKDAKLRSERARAELLELQAAQQASELIHKDHISRIWNSVTALIKAKLLGLPTRVAADVFAANDIKGIRSILETGIHDVLVELAATNININEPDRSANRSSSGDSSTSNEQSATTAKANS